LNKEELRKRITECGDAIISFKSLNSGKSKYNVCTLDFDNDYIRRKPNRAEESESTLLVFAWDTDSYRLLRPENIISIVPLSAILKNR